MKSCLSLLLQSLYLFNDSQKGSRHLALSNSTIEKISHEVIKTLLARFENFPENALSNRNAPFHEAFLNAFSNKFDGKVSDIPFFISLSSWLHGLNTTLGQSFFENVAHIICNGEKREYTSKKRGNLKISQIQRDEISKIIADLSNNSAKPNKADEESRIFKNIDVKILVNAMDFSADVFFEDNNEIVAIEIKSVKPNSGEMRGEKQKILEGKAALKNLYPTKDISFFIGFPFDPTVADSEQRTSYNLDRFMRSIINIEKFFAKDEILLAESFWDKLSSEKFTMQTILNIINDIATPEFLQSFQIISDGSKRSSPKYLEILHKWHLYSEEYLVNEDYKIRAITNTSNNLQKIYNKSAFNDKGIYSWDRYTELSNLLNKRD